uniref:Uncharacterized protein n=1 Tax=Knipowitschia caucasica TaxID=637954 RepID=A0AAV2J2L4_KNICA
MSSPLLFPVALPTSPSSVSSTPSFSFLPSGPHPSYPSHMVLTPPLLLPGSSPGPNPSRPVGPHPSSPSHSGPHPSYPSPSGSSKPPHTPVGVLTPLFPLPSLPQVLNPYLRSRQ